MPGAGLPGAGERAWHTGVCLSVCPSVWGSVRLSARGLPAWEPHTEAAGARAQGSVLCVEPELWKW